MKPDRPIILFAEGYSAESIKALESTGFEIRNYKNILESEFERVFAIFTKVSVTLREESLVKFINLNYVVTPSTGTDTIRLGARNKHDVTVITLRDDPDTLSSFFSTREIFFWLLTSLLRKAHTGSKEVESGKWNRNSHLGTNLHGKRLGILGFGRVGKHIAEVASAFGMQIAAYDSFLQETNIVGVKVASSVDELLASIDVLSINIDDRRENEAFVNTELISKFPKSGLYIVNTARGFVVDEDAIICGLHSGAILGYGTDVLLGEGEDFDWLTQNKIWKAMKDQKLNIVITPHLGGATQENIARAENSVVSTFLKRVKK